MGFRQLLSLHRDQHFVLPRSTTTVFGWAFNLAFHRTFNHPETVACIRPNCSDLPCRQGSSGCFRPSVLPVGGTIGFAADRRNRKAVADNDGSANDGFIWLKKAPHLMECFEANPAVRINNNIAP